MAVDDTLDQPASTEVAEARAKYAYWNDEIKRAKKAFENWEKRSRAIVRLYRDERNGSGSEGLRQPGEKDRMNLLWSNIQVLQPALYSRTPEPNVARRFLDRDPISRTAALIIERNLQTAQELIEFDYPMTRVRDDYLLTGRGVPWVRFAPVIEKLPLKEPVTKIDMGESGVVYRPHKGGDQIDPKKVKTDEEIGEYYETEPVDQVLLYGLEVDHIVWYNFLHEPTNDWKKVGWVAKAVKMKRPQLKKEFGDEIGNRIPLTKIFEQDKQEPQDSLTNQEPNAAEVWEIWCKNTKTVMWFCTAYDAGLLKEQKDPLKLVNFYPCPRPMWGTLTTDSLVPVPDYALYQDQANQIDLLTDRIRLLTQALRIVGVFNAANKELVRLLEEGNENDMIPVENWVAFANAGGIKGQVDWLPIEQIAAVLKTLFETRQQLRQDLYEITGISDIVRGATQAGETATAQQLKSNFSNLRLQDRQREMSRIARDTLRIMAEIQCEHYSEEALLEMSGLLDSDEAEVKTKDDLDRQLKKLTKAILLLKGDKLRTFKIDIETDATVAANQEKEKQDRVEFLQAVSPFLEQAVAAGQADPALIPLLLKLLDFGVRGFRTGRPLESAIEQFIEASERASQAEEANPTEEPPDPETQKLQAQLQQRVKEVEGEVQRHQEEQRTKQAEIAAKREEAMEKLSLERSKLDWEIEEGRSKLDKELQKLDMDIAFIDAQIRKIDNEIATGEVQGLISEATANEQPPVDEYAMADKRASLATSQTKLMEQRLAYMEAQKRLAALSGANSDEAIEVPRQKKSQVISDDAGRVVGMTSEQDATPPKPEIVLPDDLGTPGFGKPKKKVIKKFHQVIRDPNDDDKIVGITTDEVHGEEDADHLDETNEVAPGVQADGMPTPASQVAPVESGGNIEAPPVVKPMERGGLP